MRQWRSEPSASCSTRANMSSKPSGSLITFCTAWTDMWRKNLRFSVRYRNGHHHSRKAGGQDRRSRRCVERVPTRVSPRPITQDTARLTSRTFSTINRRKRMSRSRKKIVWEIERILTEEWRGRSPITTAPEPVGSLTSKASSGENSIYNSWRFDQVWLEK